MSLPAFRSAPNRRQRLDREVTRFNCDRQFKPFIYLNGGGAGPAYRRFFAPGIGSGPPPPPPPPARRFAFGLVSAPSLANQPPRVFVPALPPAHPPLLPPLPPRPP